MGLLLVLFCNVQSCILDLSYSYLYFHDICPVVTDINFMISLLCYYVLCLVRDLVLVNFFVLQYSYVCSSMMSVHPKGGSLLTALKSEIKPSTPASFHNFQAPKVVIGLNANHFHEFW